MSNALKMLNDFAKARMGDERSADFLQYARILASCSDDLFRAYAVADRQMKGSRVAEVLKAAVSAGTTSDTSWAQSLTPYAVMANGFLETLSSISVFEYLRSNGMRRCPLNMRIVVSNTAFAATAVPEGQAKPLTSGSLDLASVAILKATSIVVANNELVRFASPSAVTLFNAELQQGVARSMDSTFLNSIYASTTPAAATGSTAAAATADIKSLLASVAPLQSSKPVLIVSPSSARGLAMFGRDAGAAAFPNVAIAGESELMPGVMLLVSDMLPSDNSSPPTPAAILLDATQIVGGHADPAIMLDASRYASLQLASGTSPDSPETSSTVAQSLFHHDQTALKAEAYFGFALARSTAAASLTGISW